MSFFRILFTPMCWLRLYSTNRALDRWMIKALENPEFTETTEHSTFLNGKKIWISNYPYSYGRIYNGKALPSRSTVFKLFDAVEESRLFTK